MSQDHAFDPMPTIIKSMLSAGMSTQFHKELIALAFRCIVDSRLELAPLINAISSGAHAERRGDFWLQTIDWLQAQFSWYGCTSSCTNGQACVSFEMALFLAKKSAFNQS
mmetsp:Transcript_30570/g.63839  ORF Transcript_30570/g.63839 Transcript_30570/m.63839 type:complete len:110 (-) Transcript_30570:451-780(-)